jgi:hypothetical protein
MLRHSDTAARRGAQTIEPPELELVPVTRLEVVLDTGLMRSWDLEDGELFTEGEEWLTVFKKGDHSIRIRAPRIVCIETSQHEQKRIKKAVTPERVAQMAQSLQS